MKDVTLSGAAADNNPVDEAALVEAARHNPEAFSAVYHRYVTPVYCYLYKWAGSQAEAEDLTAQVFTEVLEGLAQYQERGTFAAWLFTIARRKAIAAYRRQQSNLPLDQIEEISGSEEDPLEHLERDENQARMAVLFAGLQSDQQDLLRLRFTARLGYAEIAAVLKRSEAAVKMAVYRLLRQLHEEWDKK
jgi:RNA polymerase sigma-70 factor (ECF subfamily)